MCECHMRHFSPPRLALSILADFDDREVDVIVIIHVFHPHSQTRRIATDITSGKLKIIHHFEPPNFLIAKLRMIKLEPRYCLGFQRTGINVED